MHKKTGTGKSQIHGTMRLDSKRENDLLSDHLFINEPQNLNGHIG
jgi:hypothetical protein